MCISAVTYSIKYPIPMLLIEICTLVGGKKDLSLVCRTSLMTVGAMNSLKMHHDINLHLYNTGDNIIITVVIIKRAFLCVCVFVLCSL